VVHERLSLESGAGFGALLSWERERVEEENETTERAKERRATVDGHKRVSSVPEKRVRKSAKQHGEKRGWGEERPLSFRPGIK